MARLLTESYELDQGSGAFLRVSNSSGLIATASPIDATRYLSIAGNNFTGYGFTGISEIYIGMFFRIDSLSSVGRIIRWYNGSTMLGGLAVDNATQTIKAITGTSTVVATSANVLTVSTIYHIQVHVLIDDAVGRIEVKLDDNQVINFTGDTKPGSDTTITYTEWGPVTSGTHSYDTMVFNDTTGSSDNTWPGVIRVLRLGPTGVGTYVNNWSRNTGSTNWEMVDEVPNDGDVTYLFTTSPNVYESFSMGDFSVANASIQAIITSAIAKKDSGTVQLAVGIRDDDNSTDYFGVNSVLGTTYGIVQERRTTDPSTGLAWTVAGARATQGLIVSTAG